MLKIETLPALLSYHACHKPDALCLKCEYREYSYKEVDEITNGIALYLLKEGIEQNSPVGIIGSRSELIPIFILSILKIGAYYVPLNDTFPIDRLNFICKDAKIRYILSDDSFNGKEQLLDDVSVLNISINKLLSFRTQLYNAVDMYPNDTMAIYYTSGSSGTPKGVIHSVQSILISNYYDFLEFSICEDDIMLLFTHWSICFSITIFAGFVSGSSICIATNQQCNDLNLLDDYVKKNGITIIHMPTQVGFQYCQITDSKTIRLLVLGGSSFPKLMKPATFRIVNVYGSTEGMALAYQDCNEYHKNSSLGFKSKHCEWIVVDENYNKVAPGCPGELLVCGPSLSKGYLNSHMLNNERYFEYEGKRVFNTKDIVRQEIDGSYTYLGRSDKMIKIRGQRVDITEIEDSLLRFESIKQCCISTVVISNNLQLCGYFVADFTINISHLRNHLRQFLPEYMMPMYLIQIDSVPLTERGKIDYSSLPYPKITKGTQYVAETRNEILIVEITRKVLKIKNVPLDCSFRDLGGDSLTFLLFYSELRNCGYFIPNLTDAINIPLMNVANAIIPDTKKINREYFERKGDLNSMCRFVLDGNEKNNANRFIVHDILKSKNRLEITNIKQTIELLFKQHPILKCKIDKDRTLLYDENISAESCLTCVRCRSDRKEDISILVNNFFEGFDIYNSLFKILFVHAKETDLIILGCHHLISDAISKRIIHNEFCLIYSDLIEGKYPILSDNSIDFILYTKCLSQLYKTDLFKDECSYWNNVLAKISQCGCRITSDLKDEHSFLFTTYKIPAEEANGIIQKSKDYKLGILVQTIYALNLVVGKKEVSQNCYQIIRHGRNQSLANSFIDCSMDLYKTIGCFAFSHPVIIGNDLNICQVECLLANIPNEGVGFDVLGGYDGNETPIYGIDVVGNSDFQKLDSEYFEKATGFNSGIEPVHSKLNIGCLFLLYVNIHNGSIILTARYDTLLFTEESANSILEKMASLLIQMSNDTIIAKQPNYKENREL